MEPLLLAVICACNAGLFRAALHEVYLPRIQRDYLYGNFLQLSAFSFNAPPAKIRRRSPPSCPWLERCKVGMARLFYSGIQIFTSNCFNLSDLPIPSNRARGVSLTNFKYLLTAGLLGLQVEEVN
jgi:hypothetical protein